MLKEHTQQQPESGTQGVLSGREVLVEETPLGLTASQMEKSNPEAFAQIKAAAAEEAIAADQKRRIELDAAFPDDLKFAAKCYSEKKSVIEAKAERHDVLAEQVAALTKENGELKARIDKAKPSATFSDDEGGSTEGGESGDKATAEFEAIWGASSSAKLRESFGGNKKKFLTLAKHEPETARALASA